VQRRGRVFLIRFTDIVKLNHNPSLSLIRNRPQQQIFTGMEIFCSHQYESGDGTIRCNDVPRSLVEGKGEQQEYFACFDHQNQ
jgi:hypothetical protein